MLQGSLPLCKLRIQDLGESEYFIAEGAAISI